MCQLQEPSAEHLATAQLVDKGVIRKILTTNFDIGLELALGRVTSAGDSAIIAHLHGSVLDQRSMVATIERLGNITQADEARDAIASTHPTRLLIVGYSGTGDLDVLPALRQIATDGVAMYWAELGGKTLPDLTNMTRIDHDLSLDGESVLMVWSKTTAASGNRWISGDKVRDQAIQRAKSALATAAPNQCFRASLALLLEARQGDAAVALLSWARASLPGFELDLHEAAVTYERASAYASAAAFLSLAALQAGRDGGGDSEASLLAGVGFLLSQAGSFAAAARSYELARALLRPRITNKDASVPFAVLDNVLRGGLELHLRRRSASKGLPTTEADSDLQVLLEHPECDPLRRALVEVCRAQLRNYQGNKATALVHAQDAVAQFRAIQHLEGWSRAARVLATMNSRLGVAALHEVNDRILQTGQARRDLPKNRLAIVLATLRIPLLSSDTFYRNAFVRRWRCWRTETAMRSIERQFSVDKPPFRASR